MPRPAGLLATAALTTLLLAGAVQAQGQPAPGTPPAATEGSQPEDVEALVKRLQEKIDRLNKATSERNEALKYLQEQVDAATGQLGASEKTTDTLRSKSEALSSTVETLAKDREALNQRLQELEDERTRRIAELEARLAELDDTLKSERDTKATLTASLEATKGDLAQSRSRVAELQEATQQRDARVGELQARITQSEEQLGANKTEIARLSQLLVVTTEQLRQVGAALDASEAQVKSQEVTIADLAQRLNQALLNKVEELAQYRSEFFGRLRSILGDRPDIRVVGDRFVFQSELLFDSGSAKLGPQGEEQLRELAQSLKEVAQRIPDDIDWVLRVDGHTDRVPLSGSGEFRTNWELSSARAISVVQFLIRQGIPPERLVAAGFGEYQPLDPRDDEIGYRRNRRIEFKLTER
jgi:chemotaxis protein MotB